MRPHLNVATLPHRPGYKAYLCGARPVVRHALVVNGSHGLLGGDTITSLCLKE